jgi:hypothetical protein
VGLQGKLTLSERLKALETALRDYYGALNEIRIGLRKKMPEKPEALILYERCKVLGLPLVEGGVLDQPYIWLQELAIIISQTELFEMINRQPEQPTTP